MNFAQIYIFPLNVFVFSCFLSRCVCHLLFHASLKFDVLLAQKVLLFITVGWSVEFFFFVGSRFSHQKADNRSGPLKRENEMMCELRAWLSDAPNCFITVLWKFMATKYPRPGALRRQPITAWKDAGRFTNFLEEYIQSTCSAVNGGINATRAITDNWIDSISFAFIHAHSPVLASGENGSRYEAIHAASNYFFRAHISRVDGAATHRSFNHSTF